MKKKLLIFISAMAVILGCFCFTVPRNNIAMSIAVESSTANVSASNTIEIGNISAYRDFVKDINQAFADESGKDCEKKMSSYENMTIKLTSDLDFTGVSDKSQYIIEMFRGTFNGDCYTIKGLPMFCKWNKGTIQQVYFEKSENYNTYYAHELYTRDLSLDVYIQWYGAGVVAGINYGTISACSVNNSQVNVNSLSISDILEYKYHKNSSTGAHGMAVGGIAGINCAEIEACGVYNSLILTSTATTYNNGLYTENCAGGICGYLGAPGIHVKEDTEKDVIINGCISAGNQLRAAGCYRINHWGTIGTNYWSYAFPESDTSCGAIFGQFVFGFANWSSLSGSAPYYLTNSKDLEGGNAVQVSNCFSKKNVYQTSSSTTIETIGNFLRQLVYIWDQTDYDAAKDYVMYNNYHDNEINTTINWDNKKNSYKILGNYLKDFLRNNAADISELDKLNISWIDDMPFWFPSNDISYTTKGDNWENWWYTEGEYSKGTILTVYTTDGDSNGVGKVITLSSQKNKIISNNKNWWIFPEISDDHCGVPYYCKEVNVSVWTHPTGDGVGDYDITNLTKYGTTNYDNLQSYLQTVFGSRKTIIIGSYCYTLTDFRARISGATSESITGIANVDTCSVSSGYTRSKANYYCEVIPIYTKTTIDIKFTYGTQHTGSETTSMGISYSSSTRSVSSGSPGSFTGTYLPRGCTTKYSFDMTFNMSLNVPTGYSKDYYYVYAKQTVGNSNLGTLSGDFAENMQLSTLRGHSANGTKTLTFSLSGNISSSTIKTYEYTITLNVYKKVELMITKSLGSINWASYTTINDLSTIDDLSSVADDYFSYYVLEGTNLIWYQLYQETSNHTYKNEFHSSTAELYYDEDAVLSSTGEISESSEGTKLATSGGIFYGYSGQSVNQPFYVLYGIPTALNRDITYTLNFKQTGDFIENDKKNGATATINYIEIKAWDEYNYFEGNDSLRYYLSTQGLLSTSKSTYGFTFRTGQSIKFEIQASSADVPKVILTVGGVQKISANLTMSGDSPLYDIENISINITVSQSWSGGDESNGRTMFVTTSTSENLTNIDTKSSPIVAASYDTGDEYYYANKTINTSFYTDTTAYLHIAELIKITLDDKAVGGSSNANTVYAINGTTLDTTNSVTNLSNNIDGYYYYTDDSGTIFTDTSDYVYTVKNGSLEWRYVSNKNFYLKEKYGATYPNITLKAVKGEAQSVKVYFHYFNLDITAAEADTKNESYWDDLEEDGGDDFEFYKSEIVTSSGTSKTFSIDSYITASSGYTYYKSDTANSNYIVIDSANAKFTIYWKGTSGANLITDYKGTLNIDVYFVKQASVNVTYKVVDTNGNAIGGSNTKTITYTGGQYEEISTGFVYSILGASEGINSITKAEITSGADYIESCELEVTGSDEDSKDYVVRIVDSLPSGTNEATITIYVDFETTETPIETTYEYTYKYTFNVYVNGEFKGTDEFKVPYTYTDTTITMGNPTVTNGSPSGLGWYYSSSSVKQYTIEESNWGTYSSCTNNNTYSKLKCYYSPGAIKSYFNADIVDPTVAEIKSAASNNPTITISVYFTAEIDTTLTLTLIPYYYGTSTEISSGEIIRKQITLTKDDVGKTFAVFATSGNIKGNVTCYPTEYTIGGQLYEWYKLETYLDVITINNTNTLISTLYGNSFTYNSHSTSVTSGTLYVYYQQLYTLTLTAHIINYGTTSVNSPITKVVDSAESWDVSLSDIYEDGIYGTIYKIEYPTGKTASDMSYTIDGTTIKAKTLTSNQTEDVYIYMFASDEEYGEAKIRVTYKYWTNADHTSSSNIPGLSPNPYEVKYAADCDSEVSIDSIQNPKLTGYTYESYEVLSDEYSLCANGDEDEIWFNVLDRGTYAFVDICVYYTPSSFNLEVVLSEKNYDGKTSTEQIFFGTITYAQIGTLVVDQWIDIDSSYSYISCDINPQYADCFDVDGDTDLMIELLSWGEWSDGETVIITLNYEYDIFVLEVSYLDTANNKIAEPIKYYFDYLDFDENVGTYYEDGTLLKDIVAKDISGYTFSKFTNGVGIMDFIDGAYKIINPNKSGYHSGTITAVYQSTLPTVVEKISKDGGATSTEGNTYTNISSGKIFTAENISGYQFDRWDYDTSAFTLSGRTLTLTATSGRYIITRIYKPNSDYTATITFNVHISQGTTATQSTSQKVTSTYGLTPNPFQNVGATAINQEKSGSYAHQYLNGKATIDLKDCVSVNFGDRATLKSTGNVPSGMTFSNIGTTFNNTQVTITSAVTSDVEVDVYYTIASTNVTYNVVTVVDGNVVKTDKTKTITFNYLTDLETSQDIVEYGVTGCNVAISYTGASAFKPSDDTTNKKLTTPSSLNISNLSGDYAVTITLTYTTSTATITFKAQGIGLEQYVTKHIYYNNYTGWGRSNGDDLNPYTSYSAYDIFGTIDNYTFDSWAFSDNAGNFFTLTDGNLKTKAAYETPSATAKVIANYTTVSVTMTFKIMCDGDTLEEDKIAYYYRIGCLASNPTNVQNSGYIYGKKNNVLTIYDDYDDYYCFKDWTIDPSSYGTISGNKLTLKTGDDIQGDFTVIANYRKAKVTIVLNHKYTDDTKDTTNTYDYYYYYNILCEADKLDPADYTDNFNIDKDEGTIYFKDRHTGKTNNAGDYATTDWKIVGNIENIVEQNNLGDNQNLQLSALDDFVADHTITITATHTAQRAKVYVYDASDTNTPIDFTINDDETKSYNPYEHYYRTASAITIDNPTKDGCTFDHWEINSDPTNLVTITGTTAKVSTSNLYSGEQVIKLIAHFKSDDEYTCKINIKLVDENNTDKGTNTLTFHYKKTGTAANGEVYLGNTIETPSLNDYVFLGWQDADTNVFTSATSSTIKDSVTDINSDSTINITAKFHIAVAKIEVTNKYNGTTISTNPTTTLNFHYTTTGTSTTTDVYLGGTLPKIEIAGYNFASWSGGDTNVFTTATSGKIKDSVSGVNYNSTINITANYTLDDSSVTIKFTGYVYRDDIEDINLVETKEIDGVYYYNQKGGSDYYNTQTITATSLIEKFDFNTTQTLQFIKWGDGATGDITLSGTSAIEIEVYYTYEATYSATFNIYYKYRENSTDSAATPLKTKTYSFGATKTNPLWNDTIVSSSEFDDYGKFKEWQIEMKTGADDYKNWFAQNTDNIMTASKQPTLTEEVYEINIYAILNVNKASVTIKYINQSNNEEIKTAENYDIYYNGYARVDTESKVKALTTNEKVYSYISGYAFQNWQSESGNFSTFFETTDNDLQVKDTSKIKLTGIIEIIITANYLPDDYTTIIVKETRDGTEISANQKTYTFHYNATSVTGDGNLKVGDKITADAVTGLTFVGWDLGDNTDYFTLSGNSLTLKKPNNLKTEITITKKYVSNRLSITYNRYYQNIDGTYTTDTSIYSYDYTTNTLAWTSGTNCSEKSDTKWKLINATTFNAYTNYVLSETKVTNEDGNATTDLSGLTSAFMEYSNGDLYVYNKGGVTSGGYAITVERTYNRPEAVLYVKLNLLDENGNQDKDINPNPTGWTIDTTASYIQSYTVDGTPYLIYYYQNGGGYKFPTSYTSDTHKYDFVKWEVSKNYGDDNWGSMFNEGKKSSYTTLTTQQTNDLNSLYVLTLTATFKKIVNQCTITVEYVDENGETTQNNTNPKSYTLYYDKTGTATGNTLYKGNTLSASKIYGYTFSKWEIISQDKTFATINSNKITFSQPTGVMGGYTATIKAYYTRNYTTINLFCVDQSNKSLGNDTTYTFYYGVSGANTDSELFKGATITAPTISEYKFESWTTSDETATQLFVANTSNPMSLKSPSVTGNYTLNLTAKYSKSTCTIHIDYKLGSVLLGSQDYEFHYTITGTKTDKDIYLGNTISPKEFTGCTFSHWSGYNLSYFSLNGNDLKVSDNTISNPASVINLTANYNEDFIKITISHLDSNNNAISGVSDRVIRYYYNGLSGANYGGETIVYDTNNASNNVITPTAIENYNFEGWNTTSSYVTIDNGELKINQITDQHGQMDCSVTAKYKAQSEYYYEFTIKYVHYENEYYNGATSIIGSKTYRFYYYINELKCVLKEEEQVDVVTVDEIADYSFVGFKNFDTQNIAGNFKIGNLLTLSGSNTINVFNKDKLSEFSFDTYKDRLQNINDKNSYVNNFIAKFTFATALAVNNISSQASIEELDGKTFEIVAYYSKGIQIFDGWITNTTTQDVNNIPVNYKVNNQNFLNGVYNETSINESVTSDTTTGQITWLGQDQRLLYSTINMSSMDPDLTIYVGAGHKNYELSFKVDVGSLRPNNTDEMYQPQHYHYIGWGESLPTWTTFNVTNPSIYTYPYVEETSQIDSRAQSDIIAYLKDLEYDSSVTSITWAGNPFNIYMQWEADEHTITIYRDRQQNSKTKQEHIYLSIGGKIGTVINEFKDTLITSAEYIAEMKKRIGEIDGWEIVAINENSQILDVNGNKLTVGSIIKDNCLYAGTYGGFALMPHFSSYTNLTVKFDYGTSVAGVGTLESIYNKTTGSNNVFEYSEKYQYNEEFKLADILKQKYEDPTPLSTKYNGTTYYLTGWTTKNINFNPENWAGISSSTYINLLKSLSKMASDVSFKRDCMNYEQVLEDGIYILSYDTASFKNLTGDNQSTITFYAVWLPYYEININTNPLGTTALNGTYLYVDKTKQTDKATIPYGVSLTNQSINFYYDIRTSYGVAPKGNGYSYALEGKVLSALDITYATGTTYYYQSSNNINRWLSSKASYQNWTYSNYNRTFSISTMMTGFVSNIVNNNHTSARTVNIYPVWKDAELKVDLEGKTKTLSTDVKLLGEYTLNAEQIDNYSIDYLTTNSNKKLNYLYGVDFINFLKQEKPLYGDNVLGDVEVVNINKSQYLYIKLTAHYVGDLYFLRINSIEYNGQKNDNDNKLRCADATVFNDVSKSYLTFKISNGAMTASTSTLPKLTAIKKVTTKPNQMFSDYSTIYEEWKYKIILNNDGYFYLAVVYGDNVYDQKSPYALLWQQIERSDGSELEYYLYNNKYAYDVFDTSVERNNEYSISVNVTGKRVFKTSGISCPNDWKFEDVGTIYAVWRVKKYHIDLSTAFDNGSKIYSNSAYLVAQAVDTNATQESDKYKYYVLNYEYNSTTSSYQFVLYTMTKSQFNSKNRWYGGWDTLGLSGIKDITDNKNSRITVTYGTELTIWVYDQSKDTNDKLVGYRLNSVDIREQDKTNATNFKVKSTGYLTCKDISGGDKNYVTSNGYTTLFDFKEVALDNNYTIKYQAITEYIKYALSVEADSTSGGVVVKQNGKETATMSKYQYTELTLGDIVNVTYKTNLGYQLVNWTLNGTNVEENYNYIRTINVAYLKTWLYAGQTGGYSVEYDEGKEYQNIGLLYANSDTIEFDLRINIFDENSNKLETYLLSEKPNGIVALYSVDGANQTAQSKLTVVNDYALTIIPKSHNGYLCYQFEGKDYAIINMTLSGKSKIFVNKDYSFPTAAFEQGVFKFDSSTLSNLVSYSAGVVISSDNRTISMNVNVATIFEISAGEDEEFAKIQDQKDRNKGSRKLVANTISIASAEQNEMLKGNGNKAYAYYGQKIELWLEASDKYYSGGTIFVDNQDVYNLALQQATEIEVTDNVVVIANFVPVTLSYSVTLKYNDNSYYKSNMNEITNLAGVQLLSEYPTYSTFNQNNEEIVDVVCDDILRLEFGTDNFNPEIFTDGKLMDYTYLIYVNGTRQQLSDDNVYSWAFDGNIDVIIEIISNTGNVRVLSNIYEASEIVVVTSTGKKQTINKNTVSFDLASGEKMTIYTKDNAGYNYSGVKFNNGNLTTYIRRQSTNEEYLGWQTFDIITSYTTSAAGTYEIVYEAQNIDIDLKYAINGEPCEDDVAGTGYYTDKEEYVISDYLTIYKPENGENEGYKFVGYSIQNATTADVLMDGKSQITIRMSDYTDFLNEDEGNYSLTIYINFICQYRISIKLDGNDFGQTDVKLSSNGDVIAQSMSASSLPIVTKYLDQSDYSKQKFELKVKSKDTKNYHFIVKANGEELKAGENYIVMKVTDTDDVYEGQYTFELNSNLEFTIKYMPREYTITNTIYEIADVDTLNKYLSGEEVELTKTVDSQLQIETKTDSSWANCYGTKNTLIFTITEKEPAYTDFALLHIKINGVIQQVKVSTKETDGIKTYIYTIDYDIKDDVNIEIVLKRVYGVEIEQ